MLTQRQIEKLQPLTEHPKYGKILQRAIPVWKNHNIICNEYGVKRNKNGKIIFCNLEINKEETHGCCLIGAALIETNHPQNISILDCSCKEFEINIVEHNSITSGFDGYEYEYDNEAQKFAKSVREIVNPIKL